MNRTAATLFATVIAACALLPSVASAADSNKGGPKIVVQIADLNLDRPADQAELVKRVERAARHICLGTAMRMESRSCAVETVNHSMDQAPDHVRRAFEAASDRHESFAVSENR